MPAVRASRLHWAVLTRLGPQLWPVLMFALGMPDDPGIVPLVNLSLSQAALQMLAPLAAVSCCSSDDIRGSGVS
jgi:hypothetical protein